MLVHVPLMYLPDSCLSVGHCCCTQVAAQAASAANPGIPPSSLMSFLRVNASIQGVVLTEFDTAITNPHYMSRFDDNSTITSEAITSASALLAATLHRLAGGDPVQSVVSVDAVSTLLHPTGMLSKCMLKLAGAAAHIATAIGC